MAVDVDCSLADADVGGVVAATVEVTSVDIVAATAQVAAWGFYCE